MKVLYAKVAPIAADCAVNSLMLPDYPNIKAGEHDFVLPEKFDMPEKKSFEWYEAKADQVARMIFIEYVKPFCRKRKWRFLTGMGEWAFFPPNTRALGRDDVILDDKEWDDIRELLSIEVQGYPGRDLGTLMPECKDYTYEEEGT